MTRSFSLLVAIAAMCVATAAYAAPFTTVSVNFGADRSGDVAGIAGRIDTENWNNASDANGAAANLVNGNGVATTASVEWSSPNTWSSTGLGEEANQGTGEDRTLMTGYLDTQGAGGQGAVVSFAGLDATFGGASYDVYVYQQGGVNNRGGEYTIGADTQALNGQFDYSDPNVVAFQNEYILGEDYIIFSGVSGDSFTLTTTPTDGDPARAGVNAVEIVARVPEPGTVTLAGLALVGLGLAARRRR